MSKRKTQTKPETGSKKWARLLEFPRAKRDPEYIEECIQNELDGCAVVEASLSENHDNGKLHISLILEASLTSTSVRFIRSSEAEEFAEKLNSIIADLRLGDQVLSWQQTTSRSGILNGLLFYR